MILGVLALDFARYMRDDAMAALNLADETRDYYVALGAMNRAIYDLEQASATEPGARSRHGWLRGRGAPGCAGGTACAATTTRDVDDEDDGDDGDACRGG